MRLEGGFQGRAPVLSVVEGNSREQFGRLMKEGVAIGDRELETMGRVSRSRFNDFAERSWTRYTNFCRRQVCHWKIWRPRGNDASSAWALTD